MSIIDEIRKGRVEFVPAEYKEKILMNIKEQLIKNDNARIDGAAHYRNHEWKFPESGICAAPYRYHAAIAEWLRSLGFHTQRYYNQGGVDNGLQVWI